MATSLFKMPFDVEKTKIREIYKSQELENAKTASIDCQEIRDIYGELKFGELHEDRPYTYTSLVTSIDGRIAFTDAPQGPLIAKLNQYDGEGAGADWWILNMLRASADGVIIGAGTMNAERDYTVHVFSQHLEDAREQAGMSLVPWNIISSLDATDIPFDHILFDMEEIPVMISTSAAGVALAQENLKDKMWLVGPVSDKSQVTDEMIEGMKANRDKVIVIATGDKAPDSHVALYIMKRFGLDKVLVETPSYMHYLVSEKMMDELFFNYSCIYVGGQALTIGKFGREFTSENHPHTRMLSIHTHSDHFFYFRHKLIYD
ncbi:MAG: dihydrofolate reductase family protein [Lachnospiraceae bacterium]